MACIKATIQGNCPREKLCPLCILVLTNDFETTRDTPQTFEFLLDLCNEVEDALRIIIAMLIATKIFLITRAISNVERSLKMLL